MFEDLHDKNVNIKCKKKLNLKVLSFYSFYNLLVSYKDVDWQHYNSLKNYKKILKHILCVKKKMFT